MKNKTIIFLVLLVVLFAGALGSGAVFGQTDSDPGISIETLYGDMSALDGLKVGMSYVTHESLYWKTEAAFDKGSMTTSSDFRYVNPLKDKNWYNSWTDRENKRDKSVRVDVKELFSIRTLLGSLIQPLLCHGPVLLATFPFSVVASEFTLATRMTILGCFLVSLKRILFHGFLLPVIASV